MTLKEFGTNRVKALAKAIVVNADAGYRAVAIQALINVVTATPVDTGRARSNWLVGDGSADRTVREAAVEPGTKGSTGGQNTTAAIREGTDKLNAAKSNTLYISNNLPYIVPLNEGSSAQAPAGFVETAVQAAHTAVAKIKLLAGT